jgi:glucan phosphoethanolaminetransferase (alkaline phosphatase superfamily)
MADEGQAGNPGTGFSDQAMDSVINRRSRWLSALAALKYCKNVSRDNEIKVRDSDRATAIALFICCLAALLCLMIPALEAHRMTFVIAADLLVGLALLMYVANRFGIVTTFQPRQALLTWQLMLGSSLLGIFLTINLALVLALVVANLHVGMH